MARIRVLTFALVCAALAAVPALALAASGCPTEPGWDYTTNSDWGKLFPVLCGDGVRQSPVNIVSKGVISSSLPRIVFHYNVADVVTLDHDDQTLNGHGEGNFITIGKTQYNLVNIHAHTPAEHTINGATPYPLELHLVHLSADGQYAVVGVFVKEGKADPGIIVAPSASDPSTVDFKLTFLIPKNRRYWNYDGSLTSPGPNPQTIGCPEVVLWLVMRTPITMSADQIQAFRDSGFACWGTDNTARPVLPINNRFIFAGP